MSSILAPRAPSVQASLLSQQWTSALSMTALLSRMALQYLANPVIMAPASALSQPGGVPALFPTLPVNLLQLDPLYGLQMIAANGDTFLGFSIECTGYVESISSTVSQQLVLATTANSNTANRTYITDNIAPHPRTWRLTGYLAPSAFEITAIMPMLMPILHAKVKLLRKLAQGHVPIIFITKFREEQISAALVDVQLESRPDVQNRQPVTLTLQEIPTLTVGSTVTGGTPPDTLTTGVSSSAIEVNAATGVPF